MSRRRGNRGFFFGAEESRHRRIARQGEDHQEVSWKELEVLASYGHVRDLIPKEGAVDPQRSFAMRYQILDKNESTCRRSPVLEEVGRAVSRN